MAHSGAGDDPQIIALTHTDFDHSFNNDKTSVSGNPLGDHTIGASWQASTYSSAIFSLITLDGDFDIEWTQDTVNQVLFGVGAIDEDDQRSGSPDHGGIGFMTNGFHYRDESHEDFAITAVNEGNTHVFADGSVIRIERRDGTIKVYDDDVEVHEYSKTYSGTMRFGKGTTSTPFPQWSDFKITDYSKVQRDGTFYEGTASTNALGDANTYANGGFQFVATRTGTISTVSFDVTAVGTSYNSHVEIWSDSGGSPSSQIGSDSDTIALSSTGTKTYTLTDVSITKGSTYWAVLVDSSGGGTGDVSFQKVNEHTPPYGSGRNDTITSITDNLTGHWKCEIVYTATGEPTPDHDTIFLVQSNDTDGSTSFTDDSQTGATVTAVDGVHHDNVQAKFGTTSIYCDGTDDEITIPDNVDYSMASGQPYTWEFWLYTNGTPANNTHCAGQGGNTASTYAWFARFNSGGTLTIGTSNGSTQRLITCSTNLSSAWHHICLMHSGFKQHLFIDGTEEGSAVSHTDVVQDVSATFEFGGGNSSASHINAWFEGMRLSRTARYDFNGFTPPTARFPTS